MPARSTSGWPGAVRRSAVSVTSPGPRTTSPVGAGASSRSGWIVRAGRAPETRPLDCSLDSSRAQALLQTRLRGVREVLG